MRVFVSGCFACAPTAGRPRAPLVRRRAVLERLRVAVVPAPITVVVGLMFRPRTRPAANRPWLYQLVVMVFCIAG